VISGAAIFLMLLPLAGAPVVFHLLMRRKRRKYVFSTPMFLHKVDPKMRSRRRLQEILLLISRVLLIAIVLLALSRLSVNTVGDIFGFGERQMVVIIVDNSGSMNSKTPDGDNTKLRTAKESAQVLLSHLDDTAKAAVLTLVDDPNIRASGDMKDGKKLLVETIGRITATEATGKPAESLMRAVSILKAASTTGAGSVHIFTDLQNSEWGSGDIDKAVDADNVRIFFHHVPTAPIESNVSLVRAQLSGRRVLPKQPHSVLVELRNDGKESVAVRLNSQDDQRKQTTRTVLVPAQRRKVSRIMIQPESKGNHWVRIWIEGDGFTGDNQAVIAYLCGSVARVFLVGDDSEFGRLPLALSPYGDGRYTSLVPEVVNLDTLPARIVKAEPVLLVMSWTEAARIASGMAGQWLENYVTGGGNLLLVPPARKIMGAVQIPGWIDAAVTDRVKLTKQVHFRILSENNAFWDDLRVSGGRAKLIGAFAHQYHPVLLPEDGRTVPLLGLDGTGTVLAMATRGRGRVICSGIAFAQQWSLLPKMQEFVVMAQTMALGSGSAESAEIVSMVAGQSPESLPGKDNDIRIVSLVGDPMDWSGSRDQFPKFVRSGGYEMRIGGKHYGLSVRGSAEEGSQEFVSGEDVPLMGKTEHTVIALNDDNELKELLAASRTGVNLYLPLLLMAMIAIMAEGILGSPRQHKMTQSASTKDRTEL
jgi:hypothetical protein